MIAPYRFQKTGCSVLSYPDGHDHAPNRGSYAKQT